MSHALVRRSRASTTTAHSSKRRNRRVSPPLFRSLLAERLEKRLLLTAVTSVNPAANLANAPTASDISATFDQPINPASATHDSFVVSRESVGKLTAATATISTDGQTVALNPTTDLLPGEVVRVTATSSIRSTGGSANEPRVWEFRAAVNAGSGQFVDSGQRLGVNQDGEIGFGDLDADGDLDAVQGGNIVWLNDGSGNFTDSGQRLGGVNWDMADIDGDGDLDVVEQNDVYLNNGSAVFTGTGQDLTPSGGAAAVEVGDIDGDGDMDAMVGIAYAGNLVWLNNGNGNFSNTGQSLGNAASAGIGFGDFDNDGDLDAYVANNGPPNRVWMNDGSGVFTDSMQALGGFQASVAVDVADVDGDGDLDAVVANSEGGQGTRVWLNDGSGIFTETGQQLNAGTTNNDVALGDIDGDGDVDAYVPGWYNPSEIWVNDGSGIFSEGLSLPFPGQRPGWVGFADVDGDGDLDAFEGNRFFEGSRVFINQNLEPSVTLSADETSIAESGGVATVTATLSEVHTQQVTIDLETSGSATATDDYALSGTQIVIAPGSTTGSVTITAVQDTVDEPDETVVVDIAGITNGQESGAQQVTTTILDDDEPPVPNVTLAVDNVAIPEAAGIATFTVTLSETTSLPVTVDLEISGTATTTDDYTASAMQITVPPGANSGSIIVTAVQDTANEPDETVIVDIANVTNGQESGVQQVITTILDDDEPPSFGISSFVPTRSGFVAELSSDVDASVLNLYGSSVGDPDVVLTGAASGPVSGSLVVDASQRSVTFIKTGDPLAPDTYTVRLRSADDGFKDLAGNRLDGDRDGTAGDDFVDSFTVAPSAAGAVTLALPDFVRGAGQDVNLPADTTAGIPLSISISEGRNVRAVDLRIRYDPALLNITAATVGAAMPAGASGVLNTNTPGLAILVFFSTMPLPSGTNVLVNLQASVPTANAGEHYGQGQVLDIHSVVVSDGQDNESPVIDDDAVQLASYFADVSGNGRINASDASQVARFAAFLETGFAGSQLTDPIIVGDISGNGRINAADASLLAQFAALIPVPDIPPIPVGVVLTGSSARLLQAGIGFPPLPHKGSAGQAADETRAGRLEDTGPLEVAEVAVDPALDLGIASLEYPNVGGDEPLPLALEEAVEELMSAVVI